MTLYGSIMFLCTMVIIKGSFWSLIQNVFLFSCPHLKNQITMPPLSFKIPYFGSNYSPVHTQWIFRAHDSPTREPQHVIKLLWEPHETPIRHSLLNVCPMKVPFSGWLTEFFTHRCWRDEEESIPNCLCTTQNCKALLYLPTVWLLGDVDCAIYSIPK